MNVIGRFLRMFWRRKPPTGDLHVIFADWWTSRESELSRIERAAIAAYEEATAAAASPPGAS